jgi:glycosyltransferase involved in cell wall biosynthesis
MEKQTLIIAHATDAFPGAHKIWGGAEQAALRLALLLKSEPTIKEFFITLPSEKEIPGFTAYQPQPLEERFSAFRKVVSFLKFHVPYDPLTGAEVKKIVKKEKADLLHLHKFDLLSFSLISAAKREHLPVVFSLYDLWALCPKRVLMTEQNEICTRFHGPYCLECTSTRGIVHRLGKKYRRPLFAHFLKHVDCFIVLSGTVKKSLVTLGYDADKIEILPLPLQIDDNEPAHIAEEPDSLLFAGWVTPHKGLHILIEALGMVKNVIPGIKLYVAETGSEPRYREGIVQRIQELGLQENVSLLGKKSNEEVRNYLSRVKGVVVPEQWGIAWPIFLTEAMYYGKPAVASDIGDISSFIIHGESGYLANYKDPSDFAEKIITMLRRNQDIGIMARKARDFILDLTDENKIKDRLVHIYRKTCKRG